MLERCINIVNTMPSVKAKWLQIRIREDIKSDFQTVAELRGLSVSALIHSLIVRAIREEKERDPKAFSKRTKVIPVESLGEINELQEQPAITKEKTRGRKKASR